MKSNKVLKLLNITRPTLSRYVKEKIVKYKVQPNGFYDYDEESVYKILNKSIERKNVIYTRVSTQKQRPDLEDQKKIVEKYCIKNGIKISDVYSDIGSGINFDRKEFQRLLDDVVNHKISKIYITYKDRLSRVSFDMFKNLFSNFNCEIVVLNDIEDAQTIEKEIFNEIISLIHCFAMKVYSSRRKKKLKCVEADLKIEDDELTFMTGRNTEDGIAYLKEKFSNIDLILLTAGSKGCTAYFDDMVIPMGAYLQKATIETTGAGDTFFGSCLSFLSKWDKESLGKEQIIMMLQFASAAASIITTRKGTLCVMPSREEVTDFISNFK